MAQSFTLNTVPDRMTVKDEPYKVDTKGQKDRIAIVWRPQNEDGEYVMNECKFVMDEYHYVQGMGYILASPEINEILGEEGSPRAATIIVQYDTNRKGEVAEPFDYEVKAWYLGGDKVESLQEHNGEHPIHACDLVVKCVDPKYQKMQFFPKTEALWLMKESVKKDVLAKVRSMQKSIKIARKVTPDELREHLGIETDASKIGGSDDVSDADFDDMLEDV